LSEDVLVIEYWNLGFICNLVLGICDSIEVEHDSFRGAGYGKIKPEQKWASKAARGYAPISKGAAVAGTQTDAAFG
jgi:hypothetical protein